MPQQPISRFFPARRRTTGKTTQSTMSRYYKKKTYKKKYPARLAGSRLNYQIAKQVSKAMHSVSESKIQPMTRFDEVNPTPIQPLAQAYTTSYVIGAIPTVWTGITGINSLTDFEFPQGNVRDGDSLFLKKSHISLDIEMNQTLPSRQVCEFRVLFFKTRRATTPLGISHSYAENLFLDIDGSYFGHSTSGKNGTDLMTQPVNKKFWYCMMDKKFILSPVQNGASPSAASTGVNACKRSFKFDIPFNKKVSFELGNTPEDVDYRTVVAIYAKTVGRDGVADVWETNVRGLTTYLDN